MPKDALASQLAGTKARVSTDEATRPAPVEPMFARLDRKEVRLRDDQIAELAVLVRQLMRARTVKVERITENTLIRVAIDLLLAHADHLRGGTERELRKSVTSAVRAPGTSADTDFGSSKVPGPQAPTVPNARGAGVRHGGVR